MNLSTELIEQALTHYSTSGAAGGLVRSVSKQETILRVIISTMMGMICSYYMTPMLMWGLDFHLKLKPDNQATFLMAAPSAIGFIVGMMAMKITELAERFLISKGGGKHG